MSDTKMSPIPDYGDHFTLEEFVEDCEANVFIDYDGSGCFATATEMTSLRFRPSDLVGGGLDRMRASGEVKPEWTHVVWFNK